MRQALPGGSNSPYAGKDRCGDQTREEDDGVSEGGDRPAGSCEAKAGSDSAEAPERGSEGSLGQAASAAALDATTQFAAGVWELPARTKTGGSLGRRTSLLQLRTAWTYGRKLPKEIGAGSYSGFAIFCKSTSIFGVWSP